MEVLLQSVRVKLNRLLSKVNSQINIYYPIWILIHFIHFYIVKFRQYFIEYLWRRVIVKYCSSILANYYYNSSIYYNFYYYYYNYYYSKSTKKNDEQITFNSDSSVEEDGHGKLSSSSPSKSLISLQDYMEQEDIMRIVESTGNLTKYPKHIAFSILKLEEHDNSFIQSLSPSSSRENNNQNQVTDQEIKDSMLIDQSDIKSLCRIIFWSWITKAHVISLYDYDGLLKKIPTQLRSSLQREFENTIQILKKCQPTLVKEHFESFPKIQFHFAEKRTPDDIRIQSISAGSSWSSELHICVFSRADGKPTLVNIVPLLSRRNSNSKEHSTTTTSISDSLHPVVLNSQKDDHSELELKESKINAVLNQSLFPPVTNENQDSSPSICSITEPELLVVLGTLQSTMGFLPWNLRLTQFYWMPELSRLDAQDFARVLQDYSKSQQRFGT